MEGLPAAARYLTALLKGGPDLDAAEAAIRAQLRVAAVTGDEPDALTLVRCRLDEDRNWRIDLRLPTDGMALIVLNEFGSATLIDLSGSVPDRTAVAEPSPAGAAAESPSTRLRPRVFVCYAHESEPHKLLVRGFVEFLISNGIDAQLDAWDQNERRDWQLWATGQIKAADFVLVIASPDCRLVGDGESPPGQNSGLRSETTTLRELHLGRPDV